MSIILTECDFSSLSKYGDHILRVRAEFADEHSDWINITFCPVDDSKPSWVLVFWFCFLFCHVRAAPARHMEVSRLGVQSEPELPAYTTTHSNAGSLTH